MATIEAVRPMPPEYEEDWGRRGNRPDGEQFWEWWKSSATFETRAAMVADAWRDRNAVKAEALREAKAEIERRAISFTLSDALHWLDDRADDLDPKPEGEKP